MQFQVPQFIEVEDKIIGPLTLKQFLYLAGAGGFSFILFFAFETWLWVVITIILGLIACAFAFIKYNGRPMPVVMLAAIKYIWLPKLYLWKHQATSETKSLSIQAPADAKETKNPLKNLWFKMNTLGGIIPNREKQLPKNTPQASTTAAAIENNIRSQTA